MKHHTDYLTFNTHARQEIIDITDDVERCRASAAITEGFILVSAMHISASVFVNDHEPNLWSDILHWLEQRIAPWDATLYRHNAGTGEDNAAAHLRSLDASDHTPISQPAGGCRAPRRGHRPYAGGGPDGQQRHREDRERRDGCDP